jgi:hypothetical protein
MLFLFWERGDGMGRCFLFLLSRLNVIVVCMVGSIGLSGFSCCCCCRVVVLLWVVGPGCLCYLELLVLLWWSLSCL